MEKERLKTNKLILNLIEDFDACLVNEDFDTHKPPIYLAFQKFKKESSIVFNEKLTPFDLVIKYSEIALNFVDLISNSFKYFKKKEELGNVLEPLKIGNTLKVLSEIFNKLVELELYNDFECNNSFEKYPSHLINKHKKSIVIKKDFLELNNETENKNNEALHKSDTIKENENPHPKIFIGADNKAFEMFKEFANNFIFDRYNDYSFIFQKMYKDKYIHRVKHIDFMDWLFLNEFISEKTLNEFKITNIFTTKGQITKRLEPYHKLKEKYFPTIS